MNAVQIREFGLDTDSYLYGESVPDPVCGPDEVMIRVRYGALNRLDDWVRIGWPGIGLALPHIPGSDFCGEIVEVGSQVVGWQSGQWVTANNGIWCGRCVRCHEGRHNLCDSFGILGESVPGVMAEYAAVPARNLIEIPAGFNLQAAAAASLTYLTAWHSLIEVGRLQPGEQVLVVGAGGGVNVAAQQIARFRGARVLVLASSAAKAARAMEEGADWSLDISGEPRWTRSVRAASGQGGVDMVVDNVGSATFALSMGALVKGGRIVTVGGTSGYDAQIPVNRLFMNHLSLRGSTMGTQADYEQVMRLVFEGSLNPVVDRVLGARGYGAAIRHLCSGTSYGKVLVDLHDWREWTDG